MRDLQVENMFLKPDQLRLENSHKLCQRALDKEKKEHRVRAQRLLEVLEAIQVKLDEARAQLRIRGDYSTELKAFQCELLSQKCMIAWLTEVDKSFEALQALCDELKAKEIELEMVRDELMFEKAKFDKLVSVWTVLEVARAKLQAARVIFLS